MSESSMLLKWSICKQLPITTQSICKQLPIMEEEETPTNILPVAIPIIVISTLFTFAQTDQ